MIEDQFFERIDPVLETLGTVIEAGEEYGRPPLDVLRYYVRRVSLSWVPIVGRGLAVTAVVRQPVDVGLSVSGYQTLLTRLAMAVNGRFPPWRGLTLGLTAIVLTPEPIGPGDDEVLRSVLDASSGALRRMRVVPFGLIRVNMGQEALAFAINDSPDHLFSEPQLLADRLCDHLRRFVPLIEA
jgi:hypothetical protein